MPQKIIDLLDLEYNLAISRISFDDTLQIFSIFSGEYNTVQKFKLGGMVEKGSLQRVEGEDLVVTFTVTDFQNSIDVVYVGVLPNLFKENSGVVAS